MELLVATKNPGKFAEISEVLCGLPIVLKSLRDLGLNDDVEEHGATHEENAILKARYFFQKTGMMTLGEDSGIHVDAFPGELGVQTRRWGGLENATDEEWVTSFLDKMKNFPLEKRGAKFVCFAALVMPMSFPRLMSFPRRRESTNIFSGETRGRITERLEAPIKAGIPISSCFCPEGFNKVYAALSTEEKNRVSHRGKAMAKLAEFLLSVR